MAINLHIIACLIWGLSAFFHCEDTNLFIFTLSSILSLAHGGYVIFQYFKTQRKKAK